MYNLIRVALATSLALATPAIAMAESRGGLESTVTVGNATVVEGNGGLVQLVFPLTINPALDQQGNFTVNTQAGSATSGTDYTPLVNQVLNIPAGITSGTILVNVVPDNLVEPDETLTLLLSNPSLGLILQTNQGLGTINNDDSAQVQIASVSIAEGNTTNTVVSLTATLSAPVQGEVRANFASDDVTAAVSDLDYDALAGTLVFPQGGAPINLNLTVRGDRKVEANETLTLLLTGLQVPPSITTVSLAANPTITITNDDRAVVSVNSPAVLEGNSGTTPMVFNVQLDQPIQGGLTLTHQSADGNNANPLQNATIADNDYQALNGTTSFPAGIQQRQLTVLINGDNEVEPNQQLRLLLSNPVLAPGINPADLSFPATTLGTITNDDSTVLSVNNVQIAEGNSGTRLVTLNLALSNPAKEPIALQFASSDITATAGSDYVAQNGTVNFASGVQAQTLNFTINGDTLLENNETFRVTLTDPSNAVTPAGPVIATVTILNDDAVSLRIEDASLIEGNSGNATLVFPVALAGQSAIPVRVGFATRDITALAGFDYLAQNGTLEFLPGETAKTVIVAVLGELQVERDETFAVDLSSPVPPPPSVVLERATATGTIRNDDGEVIPVPTLGRFGWLLLFGLVAVTAVTLLPRRA